MDYKSMKIEDIIQWCKDNAQVSWLKEAAAKEIPVLDDDGNQIRTRKITFIELKIEFARKFMPEIMPKSKEKKPSMFELIESL